MLKISVILSFVCHTSFLVLLSRNGSSTVCSESATSSSRTLEKQVRNFSIFVRGKSLGATNDRREYSCKVEGENRLHGQHTYSINNND